jgi:hypothetical protein
MTFLSMFSQDASTLPTNNNTLVGFKKVSFCASSMLASPLAPNAGPKEWRFMGGVDGWNDEGGTIERVVHRIRPFVYLSGTRAVELVKGSPQGRKVVHDVEAKSGIIDILDDEKSKNVRNGAIMYMIRATALVYLRLGAERQCPWLTQPMDGQGALLSKEAKEASALIRDL